MKLTLRQIRYFVATAEIGQISQAALALHVSQSAVTSAIQMLESLISRPLFIRSQQGVVLTDSGRHFLSHAYAVLHHLEEAVNLPDASKEIEGTLRLAASFTVMGYFLPFHLQRLSQWYSRLNIQIHEARRQQIEQGLLNHRFDIALVLTDNLTHPDIIAETLFTSERRLWLSAQHPLLQYESLSLENLLDEAFIMLTVDEAEQSAMRYWNQAGLQPKIKLRTESVESVRSMVANGFGISILSDLVYRPWSLEGKRIETRALRHQTHPMPVGLAWLRDIPFTPIMHLFRDYFRSIFQAPNLLGYRR